MLSKKHIFKSMSKLDEKTKERLFEAGMVVVGLVGLLILFTLLFKGPGFIFGLILNYFNIRF